MVSGSLPFPPQRIDARALIEEANELVFPRSFSPLLADLLRRMFVTRASERPSVMQLQSHPWLHGVSPLPPSVAPQPITFYRVPNIDAINKFRRTPVKPDAAVLAKCEEYGIDREKLAEALHKGLTTDDTTSYFFGLYPLAEIPERPPAPRKRLPAGPEASAIVRRGSASPVATGKPPVVLPRPGQRQSLGKHDRKNLPTRIVLGRLPLPPFKKPSH
jgi:hypothetical protein